jgi:hypothetical protein
MAGPGHGLTKEEARLLMFANRVNDAFMRTGAHECIIHVVPEATHPRYRVRKS